MKYQLRKCPSGASCPQIHICRDYLLPRTCPAGETCAQEHEVKWRIGAPDQWSNERRLQFVAECHPQMCINNNSPTGCLLGASCFNAHLCNDWLLARCRRSPCALSHHLYNAQAIRVYTHFSLEFSTLPEADLRAFVLPQPALEAGVELLPSPTSSIHSASTSKPSLFSTTATTSTTTAVPKSYAAALAAKSKKSNKSPAAAKPANLLRAVPKAKPAALAAYPSNDAGLTVRASPNNVLQHLLKLGGWNLWPQMVHEMRLPSASFAAFQEYMGRRAGGSSFLLRHLHFIQSVYRRRRRQRARPRAHVPPGAPLLAVADGRVQEERGAVRTPAPVPQLDRGPLHGGRGLRARPLVRAHMGLGAPVPTHMDHHSRRQFIRRCHPSPCPAYNSALGCSDAHCRSLHICALFPYGQCSDPELCRRSHDIRSNQCAQVFCFFSLDSAPRTRRMKAFLKYIMPLTPATCASKAQPLLSSDKSSKPSLSVTISSSLLENADATTQLLVSTHDNFVVPPPKCPSLRALLGNFATIA